MRALRPRWRWLLVLLIAWAAMMGSAQARWELRVCVPPDDLPSSDQFERGYNNKVARLVADALGADLHYVWTPIGRQTVRDHLRTGACDVVMGVPDGYLGLLSTIPYYQIPHVFLYHRETGLAIDSLEDPALRSLRVATYPLGLADFALRQQGITPVLFHPTDLTTQMAVARPLVEAVRQRRVDVAILSGSVGAQYVKTFPDELAIRPVTPEVAPPFVPMFQTGTMAVRPGDQSLRDALDRALASRWDAVQDVFHQAGIPLLPLPHPGPGSAEPRNDGAMELRVGVVLPVPSGVPAVTDPAGASAQLGAMFAEDVLDLEAAEHGIRLRVLVASAPDAQAARRAAQRLVEVDGVAALVGGFGVDDVRALDEVARASGIPFFNVGASADALRQETGPSTFHVEARASTYLDALVRWFVSYGARRWIVVYPASDEGLTLHEHALDALGKAGAIVVASFEVEPERRTFTPEADAIVEAGPDAVLSLLAAENQDFFLAQLQELPSALRIVHFPHAVTQTRDYWMRMSQASSAAEHAYRPVLWEPTLGGPAAAVNERFGAQFGVPMDGPAWAVYASVHILLQAAVRARSVEGSQLAAYIARPGVAFDVAKRVAATFGTSDRQLQQPLYLVRGRPGAVLGVKLSERLALAELVAELPVRDGAE